MAAEQEKIEPFSPEHLNRIGNFELAMAAACIHYGLPLTDTHLEDFTTVVLETAGWDTVCLLSPSSRVSGHPSKLDEEVARLRAGMESTERGRQVLQDLEVQPGTIPVLQSFLEDTSYGYPIKMVNPALDLPALDHVLESRRLAIVQSMHKAAEWYNTKRNLRLDILHPKSIP